MLLYLTTPHLSLAHFVKRKLDSKALRVHTAQHHAMQVLPRKYPDASLPISDIGYRNY